jgi:hypothetical protein
MMEVGSIPEDLLNDHETYERYIGNIWAHFFRYSELNSDNTVIEVGAGKSFKIGFALVDSAFEGDLYLIDPLQNSLQIITEKYQNNLPKARIYPIQATLSEAVSYLPKKPDFLIANHVLDDMLLATKSNIKTMTEKQFVCNSDEYKKSSLALQSDTNAAISSIVSAWKEAISILKPRVTILSQYPSLNLNESGFNYMNHYAYDVLLQLRLAIKTCVSVDCIQKLLDKHENFNNRHLRNILNAIYWMIFFNSD